MLFNADISLGNVLPAHESPTFVETYLEMEKLLESGLYLDCITNPFVFHV
jgi:hypothetical protein